MSSVTKKPKGTNTTVAEDLHIAQVNRDDLKSEIKKMTELKDTLSKPDEILEKEKELEGLKVDLEKANSEVASYKSIAKKGAEIDVAMDGTSESLEVLEGNRDMIQIEIRESKRRYASLLSANSDDGDELPEPIKKAKIEFDGLKLELEAAKALVAEQKQLRGAGSGDSGDEDEDEITWDDITIAESDAYILHSHAVDAQKKADTLRQRHDEGGELGLKAAMEKAEQDWAELDIAARKADENAERMANELNSKPLFVGEDDQGDGLPEVKVTEPAGEYDPGDNPKNDPEDLFSPGIARQKAGQSKDMLRLEGWRGGISKKVITARGPTNASSYRLEKEVAVGIALDKDIPDITLGRYGEVKDGKKYRYGNAEQPVIQGVAWDIGNAVNPLDLLIPVRKSSTRSKLQVTIKIKWTIIGVARKSWETRTTIRRLWGRELGDLYIYEAAKVQERRYTEWLNKERLGTKQSPSPYPPSEADKELQRRRNEWLAARRPGTTPPAEPVVKLEPVED